MLTAAARDRQMPRLARLDGCRAYPSLTLSDEIETATSKKWLMDWSRHGKLDADQPARDWGLRHGTTNVAIARWLVRARRPKRALDFVDLAEEDAIRGGQLLSLAKLRVIRAQAHLAVECAARRDQRASCLRSVFLETSLSGALSLMRGCCLQPVVQAALDGDHVVSRSILLQRRQLSEIMHQWIARITT